MIRRRTFLQETAATVLASACFSPEIGSALENTRVKPQWIDAHVHVWTPDTVKYPIGPKYQKSDMVPTSFTPEELFRHCEPQDVAKVVLIQMSFYQTDNRYMLDCMATHPGKFSGVAIVDEAQPNVVASMKSLAEKGVRGFRLYTDKEKASTWLDSKGMNAMWSYAADSGLAMCLLANPDALPIVHSMCEKYPRTPVVIDHFARIGVSGTVQESDLNNLLRLSKFPNLYVKTSAFYALGQKKAPYTDLGTMIQKLVKEYGANRLMWASDCPYQVEKGHTYSDSISLIRDKLDFLTAEEKESILRKTADKVYFS